MLNRVEMQIAVVGAEPAFWTDALAWGRERGLLTSAEAGMLGVLANAAGRALTERQAAGAVEVLSRLQSEGYAGELPIGS